MGWLVFVLAVALFWPDRRPLVGLLVVRSPLDRFERWDDR